jgi:replicative DNA helicase
MSKDEPPIIAGRVPPHDLDAEAAVLSAILLDPSALDRVQEVLGTEDFYADANGRIFEAAQQVALSHAPVDIQTVASWLRDRERLVQVGGPSYLAQIADKTPAVANVVAHARIVADHARKRRVIAACQRIAAEGYGDTGPTQEWLDAAEMTVCELARAKDVTETRPIRDAIRSAYEALMQAGEGGSLGLPTGLRDLDRLLGGLKPGNVTVIGARASMGKTSLALNIARHVAAFVEARGRNDDRPPRRLGVLIFSMEMKREELAEQLVFFEAGVDFSKLKEHGRLTQAEWGRITGAAQRLASLPIYIDDTPALSPMAMRAKARRVRAELARHGIELALVVVDYLQLMDGAAGLPRNHTREQEVAALSKAVKGLAGELDCHAIVLSQINRALEARSVKDKRPRMAELRESGSIEADASNVILVYRDEFYFPETEDKGVAELIVEKQRRGKRAVVRVAFDAATTRFSDLRAWSNEDAA